jgi:hypothetical protein
MAATQQAMGKTGELGGVARLVDVVLDKGEAQAGRQIFQYVGPLPPYSTGDVRLQREEEPDGSAV